MYVWNPSLISSLTWDPMHKTCKTLYVYQYILHAPEKIVILAKMNIKIFWCHPVSGFFSLTFFSVFCYSWARLSQRAPPPSPHVWTWPWTPRSNWEFCLLLLFDIIIIIILKNLTTMNYYFLRASYLRQPILAK